MTRYEYISSVAGLILMWLLNIDSFMNEGTCTYNNVWALVREENEAMKQFFLYTLKTIQPFTINCMHGMALDHMFVMLHTIYM